MENFNRKEFLKKMLIIGLIYFFIVGIILTYIFAFKLHFHKALGGLSLTLEKGKKLVLYIPCSYYFWRFKYLNQLPKLINITDGWFKFFSYGYLVIMLVLARKKQKETVHGSARWSTISEIKKMNLYSNTGLVLGKDKNNHILRDNSDKHVFFAAPTRGGKGINTVNPTSFDWTKSIVFNDIKGELWRDSSGYRKNVLGQKVFMFSPVDTDGVSCSYNPLDCIAIGTPNEFADVQVITQTLIDTEGKGEGDHWVTSASNFLNAVILHVKYAKPNASLYDVADFVSPTDSKLVDNLADILGLPREDEDSEKGVAQRTLVNHGITDETDVSKIIENEFKPTSDGTMTWRYKDESTFNHLEPNGHDPNLFREIYGYKGTPLDARACLHPLVAKEFNSLFNTPDKERGSIISTATQKLKIFLDVIISSHIRHSDFTVQQLMDERCSLYLVTPPKAINRTRPLFRLIFTQIVYELTGRMKGNKKRELPKTWDELWNDFSEIPKQDRNGNIVIDSAGYSIKKYNNFQKYCIVPFAYLNERGKHSKLHKNISKVGNKIHDFLYMTKEEQEELEKQKREEREAKQRIGADRKVSKKVNLKEKNSILLLIDEFPALGKLDIIEQGIPYIAGYGLKCLLIAQSINQLKKIYGRDNSILDNCSIQLYLTPNENQTATDISTMFGSYTKKIYNETRKGIELFPSRSSSYVGRKLMMPEEVRTMPYDKVLILLTGQNPIKGNKIFSFREKEYKDNATLYPCPAKSDVTPIPIVPKAEIEQSTSQNNELENIEMTNDIPKEEEPIEIKEISENENIDIDNISLIGNLEENNTKEEKIEDIINENQFEKTQKQIIEAYVTIEDGNVDMENNIEKEIDSNYKNVMNNGEIVTDKDKILEIFKLTKEDLEENNMLLEAENDDGIKDLSLNLNKKEKDNDFTR